jgi:hypothetical protein
MFVIIKLFIIAEKKSNSDVRECERLRQERKRQIDLVSDPRMLSLKSLPFLFACTVDYHEYKYKKTD